MEIEFSVAEVEPLRFASSPTAVMMPFASVSTDATNLVRVLTALEPDPPELAWHECSRRVPMSTSGEVDTASEIDVRHAEAARMTSDTRARMV